MPSFARLRTVVTYHEENTTKEAMGMEVLNTSASGWNRGFGFMTPDLSGIPTVDDQPDHTTMPTTPTKCYEDVQTAVSATTTPFMSRDLQLLRRV